MHTSITGKLKLRRREFWDWEVMHFMRCTRPISFARPRMHMQQQLMVHAIIDTIAIKP
jgi:hypothetical protein